MPVLDSVSALTCLQKVWLHVAVRLRACVSERKSCRTTLWLRSDMSMQCQWLLPKALQTKEPEVRIAGSVGKRIRKWSQKRDKQC